MRSIAFSRTALVASIAMVVVACSPTEGGVDAVPPTLPGEVTVSLECEAREADGNLHIYHRESRIPVALLDRFEEEMGVEVVEDFYDSDEALYAKLQSGASFDLVIATDHMVERLVDEGYLSELDRRLLPNFANLAADFENPVFDPGSKHSAAFQWGTTGLGINNGLVPSDPLPSWSLFFDSTIEPPGGLSLLNETRETMGDALRYLGYSANTGDENQLKAASALIADAGERARFDSEAHVRALLTGDLAVAHVRGGDLRAGLEGVDDPSSFSYVIPAEGGTLWVDSMTVPLAAENPCTAHAFINFILDLENAAELANAGRFASPNGAAQGLITPELLDNEMLYPSAEQTDSLDRLRSTRTLDSEYTEYFLLATG